MYFDLENEQFLYDNTKTSNTIIKIDTKQQKEIITALNDGRKISLEKGKFIFSQPRPTAYHEFNEKSKTWELSKEQQAKQLARLKTDKLSEINAKSVAVIDSLVNEKIPQFEMQTWNVQSAEAKAFKLDETALTPTLDLIAKNRGIDRIALIKKAYKKAGALEQATAVIVGQRQALQDKTERASTIEELEKIEVIFKL